MWLLDGFQVLECKGVCVWRPIMEVKTSGKPIDQLLEKVLCMNILSSDYFKELYRLKTYHEVVDEIYNQVDHVEPWMTGNCRGPSTAFCLLYKFFTMKLTVKQMHGLLKHPDSPYIRAVSSPWNMRCLLIFWVVLCFYAWSLCPDDDLNDITNSFLSLDFSVVGQCQEKVLP